MGINLVQIQELGKRRHRIGLRSLLRAPAYRVLEQMHHVLTILDPSLALHRRSAVFVSLNFFHVQ